MTPKDTFNLDQALAATREIANVVFPTLMYRFFSGCVAKGFTRDEALELTKPLAINMASVLIPVKRGVEAPEKSDDSEENT